MNDALERSRTWGEFRSGVGNDLATVTYLELQYDDCVPDGDEPVDADEIPGFTDGFWPDNPKQSMIDWLQGILPSRSSPHAHEQPQKSVSLLANA